MSSSSDFKNSLTYKVYKRLRGGSLSPMERIRYHQSQRLSWFEIGIRRAVRPMLEADMQYRAMSPATRAMWGVLIVLGGVVPYEMYRANKTGFSALDLLRRHYELRYASAAGDSDGDDTAVNQQQQRRLEELRHRRERVDRLFEF